MNDEQLPPLPGHPEPHAYRWSSLEEEAIRAYGKQCARAALAAQVAQEPQRSCSEANRKDALADIACIAHDGGLALLSEQDALCHIRRLTLRHWPRAGRFGERQKAVIAAINAAMKEKA